MLVCSLEGVRGVGGGMLLLDCMASSQSILKINKVKAFNGVMMEEVANKKIPEFVQREDEVR